MNGFWGENCHFPPLLAVCKFMSVRLPISSTLLELDRASPPLALSPFVFQIVVAAVKICLALLLYVLFAGLARRDADLQGHLLLGRGQLEVAFFTSAICGT